MEIIKCSHPVIIRHPLLWQFIANGFDVLQCSNGNMYKFTSADKSKFYENGKVTHGLLNILTGYMLNDISYSPTLSPIVKEKPANWDEIKHLYHPVYRISAEEALNYCVFNQFTGETRPVYLVVGCGHCPLCVSSKKRRLSTRLELESLRHDNPPMFVRLSFDNAHYPTDVTDLQQHTRPIQLFHKRLRKYMKNAEMNTDFKYFVTSEYGSKTGRLHYHALYYGLHNCNYVPILNTWEDKQQLPKIYRFTDIIRKCWKNGFVEVEVARDAAAAYALKYMQKDYTHKTKQLKSIYMGKPEIDKRKDFLRAHPDVTNFTITTKDGTTKTIPMYGFMCDMVYPSVSKQVPKETRDMFLRCANFCNNVIHDTYFGVADRQEAQLFIDKFSNELKLFGYENIKTTLDYRNYGFFDFYKDLEEIYNLDIDFEQVYYLDSLRQIRNNRVLMQNISQYDIPHELSKINIQIYKLINKETDGE